MYRITDIENIKIELSSIQEKAAILYKTNFEPTYSESNEVYKAIIEYIKKNKRIVYGGYAQNSLIKIKNINDVFYKETETPDIEFYSFEPLVDTIQLCDFLYKKNFKYVQGTDGVHTGTYKIFVNFINYCDISYLAKNIYNNCLYIEDKLGIRYAHPYFMYVDFFRVFADPMTSYWRLDKSFNRYIKLEKYYPIENAPKNDLYKNIYNPIYKIIKKKIIQKSKLINIGLYAYNYYIKKNGEKPVNIDFYELISIDYKTDSKNILNKLKSLFGNKITYNEFSPFYEFFDKKTEYLLNNKIILRLYANNSKCVVCNYSNKKKCYIGTYQLVYLYFLANYIYNIINKNKQFANNYNFLLYNLNKIKNEYLDKNNKTVLDETPFQEFTMKCIGDTTDFLRKARLDKKKNNKDVFRYTPTGAEKKIPNYIYPNHSGNKII